MKNQRSAATKKRQNQSWKLRIRKKEKPAEGKARSGRFVNRPYGEEKRKARSCGELELITPKRRQKKE